MFLHLSIILFTEGWCLATTSGQTPPWAYIPHRQIPPLKDGHRGDGKHPTGMHSCCVVKFEADEENRITYESL